MAATGGERQVLASFPDLRPNAYLRATPIAIDAFCFTQDAHGLVVAIDGATGRTIGAAAIRADEGGRKRTSTRGVDYWRGGVA